jgi:hypothetical protein
MSAKTERSIPIDRRANARLATREGVGNDVRRRKGDAIEFVRRRRNRNGDAAQPVQRRPAKLVGKRNF